MLTILLPGEENSMLAQAYDEGARDWMMIYLALNTGLRNTELISLIISDVYDFNVILNFIDLRKSTTKGKKARQIPLHQSLRHHLEYFINWKREHGEPIDPGSPLFLTKKTHLRVSSRDFQRITRSISIKAIRKSVV